MKDWGGLTVGILGALIFLACMTVQKRIDTRSPVIWRGECGADHIDTSGHGAHCRPQPKTRDT